MCHLWSWLLYRHMRVQFLEVPNTGYLQVFLEQSFKYWQNHKFCIFKPFTDPTIIAPQPSFTISKFCHTQFAFIEPLRVVTSFISVFIAAVTRKPFSGELFRLVLCRSKISYCLIALCIEMTLKEHIFVWVQCKLYRPRYRVDLYTFWKYSFC